MTTDKDAEITRLQAALDAAEKRAEETELSLNNCEKNALEINDAGLELARELRKVTAERDGLNAISNMHSDDADKWKDRAAAAERALADAQQQIKTLEGEIECHDAEETGWQHDLKQARDSEADALAALSAAGNVSRDWPEDFAHENGNYQCRCLACGEMFVGHKRRTACKLCEDARARQALSAARSALVDAAVDLSEGGDIRPGTYLCYATFDAAKWSKFADAARTYMTLREEG